MISKVYVKFLLKFAALFILPTTMVVGQFTSSIEIVSYRHEINKEIYKYNHMQLVNYSNHKVLNGCVEFLQDIQAFDVTIAATIPKVNAHPWTLGNITLDGCKIIEKDTKVTRNIVNILIKGIKDNIPQLPGRCPLKKEKKYCFINFSPNSLRILPYFPATKINFFFGMQQKGSFIYRGFIELNVQGRV